MKKYLVGSLIGLGWGAAVISGGIILDRTHFQNGNFYHQKPSIVNKSGMGGIRGWDFDGDKNLDKVMGYQIGDHSFAGSEWVVPKDSQVFKDMQKEYFANF